MKKFVLMAVLASAASFTSAFACDETEDKPEKKDLVSFLTSDDEVEKTDK